MSYTPIFTYDPTGPPIPNWIRLMISDTQEFGPDGTTPIYVFSDQEIAAVAQIVTRTTFQSSQFYTPPAGGYPLPNQPLPLLRIAAMLLDAMATNSAKLAAIVQILDVKLDPAKAAQFLRAQAQDYRDQDDNSGTFMVIEQVNNLWSLQQRYWKQLQRMQGTSIGG